MNEQILGDQDPNVTEDMYDDIGGGISSSFPVISYRNSRWRVRWQGNEELLVDDKGRPVEEIGICLAKVPNHKSKRYWVGGYQTGSNKAPDCWSNDAIRPHPSLIPPAQPQGWPNPRPITCAECYWDQFGTSMRQDGSVGKGKACSDYKRCVVKIYYPQMPIGFEAAEGQLFLMQIPPDSLQALKKYGDDLARERLAAAATITFVGLVVNDKNVSYPKLAFRKGPKLSTEELEAIKYARGSIEATRILNEMPMADEAEAIAYAPEEAQEDTVQPVEVQPQPVQVRPAQPQARPNGGAPAARATGMPPQPTRPAQPAPSAPQQPSARAINPASASMQPNRPAQPRTNPVPTRQPGEINRAVNRPAAPPPSARPVRPALVAPEPVQEQEYMASEVEDELDKSFGDLAARGIIEQ